MKRFFHAANIEHRIDNHLLVIVMVVIFFGCCLSIGALVAYKMRLLSPADNACIKHSESSDPQSNATSNVPNEDFDLVECVAETIPVAVKMKVGSIELLFVINYRMQIAYLEHTTALDTAKLYLRLLTRMQNL